MLKRVRGKMNRKNNWIGCLCVVVKRRDMSWVVVVMRCLVVLLLLVVILVVNCIELGVLNMKGKKKWLCCYCVLEMIL